ncbi:MAG: LysE family transporter [Bacillota bacterium]
MNSSELFLTSFLIGFSGAIMPGPLLTMVIKESLSRGWRTALALPVSHALLELALLIGLLLGVGQLLEQTLVKGIIAVIGGLVLAWMGYDMLKSQLNPELAATVESSARVRLSPWLAGSLTSASSPYFWLWWATIGMSYIALSRPLGPWGIGAFYTGHIAADLVWYGGVILALTQGRRLLSPRLYTWIIRICGLFLIYISLTFIYQGWGWLR